VENSTLSSNAADAASRTDREQLNNRLRVLEATVQEDSAQRRSEAAAITQKLTEVETQFCASDIVRNLLHANELRLFSLLWAKIYPGEHMPTDNAYYPRVCNRAAPEAR
jgi:hypothetical protein